MRYGYILLAISFTSSLLADESVVTGTISVPGHLNVALRVWALPTLPPSGDNRRLPTKPEIYAAAADPARTHRFKDNRFRIPLASDVPHCVFAFADLNDNGRWEPATPEPFGWFAEEPAGTFVGVAPGGERAGSVNFALTTPSRMPSTRRHTEGGFLSQQKSYPVLRLSGDARARGHAHGYLLAQQIIDFFRFYVLEEKLKSAEAYQQQFARFLHSNYEYPPEFAAECQAMIDGMKASGVDLRIPELGRDFSVTEIYAINGYIETRAMQSSCTQFAAWGTRTESTDVEGGMLTGRNMDGEIDLRRVTVSHFLLMAVDPEQEGQHRYISMMWPGFISTISGINQAGMHCMENAGMTGPGPVVDKQVPFSWVMRECLAQLGPDATAQQVQDLVDRYDNTAGGTCGPGCITLFATPYHGQTTPAFVLEGDRFGERVRAADEAPPYVPQVLMASNHHLVYGADEQSQRVFGNLPSFSSLWRYEAGKHKIESWHRTGRQIGTAAMQELLQTVSHGTTEYSIITRPNQLEFDVAVASMKPEMWDAPYRRWTTFRFDELFVDADE